MLRVGYPATLMPELLREFPSEIDLIAVSDKLDHDVEIDVWIPDPYPTRAMRGWPHLHGVSLSLCMLAGTEWIPGVVGPHVTICNAHGAHNTATAGVDWWCNSFHCLSIFRCISISSIRAFGNGALNRASCTRT